MRMTNNFIIEPLGNKNQEITPNQYIDYNHDDATIRTNVVIMTELIKKIPITKEL
jgi:hypothetical protein